MTLRTMNMRDMQVVLGWAADEGWNPGIDDAAAFLAADPAGFLIKEVDGQPVAAISVVNHDAKFAFLGLYLCRPEFRGHGFGMEVWRAGLHHAGDRCVGLDGVPAQQDNYEKSGFVKAGRTIRFKGDLPRQRRGEALPALARDTGALVKADADATGIQRPAFSQAWLSGTGTRHTFVLRDGPDIVAFATARACGEGIKVGPLLAQSAEQALALLTACRGDRPQCPIFVDVPDTSADLMRLLQSHGFVPVFETARMYCGTPPSGRPPRYYAIATMELG